MVLTFYGVRFLCPFIYKRPYFNSIKNMLIRRKESDTYLATIRRHRWSRQITMKINKILELSANFLFS